MQRARTYPPQTVLTDRTHDFPTHRVVPLRSPGRVPRVHGRAGAKARDGGVDGVAHERIGIDLGRHPLRQLKRSDADDRCPQEPQRDVRIYRRWQDTLVDAALHASEDALLEFGHERELLGTPGRCVARVRSRNTRAKYCGCFLLNS